MTPAEYKSARATLGLSHDELAAWLGVNRASSYKWEGGVNEVPATAARLITLRVGLERLDRWTVWHRQQYPLIPCETGECVRYDDIAPLLAVREGE